MTYRLILRAFSVGYLFMGALMVLAGRSCWQAWLVWGVALAAFLTSACLFLAAGLWWAGRGR